MKTTTTPTSSSSSFNLRSFAWICLVLAILVFLADSLTLKDLIESSCAMVGEEPQPETRSTGIHPLLTNKNPDKVLFVVVMGLEGTGHHLVHSFGNVAPSTKRINAFGLADAVTTLRHDVNYLWATKPNPDVDIGTVYNDVVQNLDTIRQTFVDAAAADNGDDVPTQTVFLNGMGHYMSSYPQGRKEGMTRFLKYPELEIFYAACEEAQVSCGQVYIHRDPYEVVRSTLDKRGFHPNVWVATKLYIAMLGVMHLEMSLHPDRTLACWGLFDRDNSDDDEDPHALWNSVRDLMGWSTKQQDAFTAVKDQLYKPPPPPKNDGTENTRNNRGEQLLMQTMIEAHERTLALCRAQVYGPLPPVA